MTAVRGWQLLIDWSDDGTYGGTLEDVSNYVDRSTVTVGWGRSVDTNTLTAPTAELDFSLINRTRSWDRWFSPENTSSPIYGHIYPGHKAQISKTVAGGGTLYFETFATNTGGWTAVSGGTVTRVGTPSEDGNGALSYVPPGAVATVGVTRATPIGIMLIAPSSVVISLRVQASVTFADTAAVIDWFDSTGALVSSSTGPTTALAAGVWTTVSTAGSTPPATAVSFQPRLRIGSTPPATTTFYVDTAAVLYTPLDAGKTYVLHAGILDDVEVDSAAAARTFSGKVIDAFGRVNSGNLSTTVYQSIRTGDAINVVLDAIGWPSTARAIDPGVTIIPYWWEEGTDPAEAITKLVNSDGPPSIAYVEAGVFVFRDRHHRLRSAASNTPQGLYSLIMPAGSGPGYDFKVEKGSFAYDYGLRAIVNTASFSVDVRGLTDVAEVWTSEDPIGMNSGDTQTFFVQPSDPVINAIAPTMASGDIQVTQGTFTATIDRTSGQKFILVVTCTGTGAISRLALRGYAVAVTRTVQASSSDQASINRYDTVSWPDEVPWANAYDAQAIADRIVAVYANNRARVSFTIVNFNDRYETEMCSVRISDRVTVRNDVLGINSDFYVERLEHSVDRWQIHRLKLYLIAVEPVQAANAFTFDVSGKGFDQGAFAVPGIDNAATMFIFDQSGQGFDQGLIAT